MKRLLFTTVLSIFLSGFTNAQSPKREMRAAWLTTCWGIDWPKTADAGSQQAEMINILDAFANANMNAVFFQVRGRSDAMYNSKYEPWSSDLRITRGTNPGYDPLQFVIDEAHKRGMEVHAWINPYRYESTLNAWEGLPGDYKNNPEWAEHIITYAPSGGGQMSIFDPGRPKVVQLIKNIVVDILEKYDVDGIIFDDYFYQSGTGNLDAATQALYKPSDMDVGDWRRNNVNNMVAAVYDTIQQVKPHIRFGISPAGVAKGGAADAGISPPNVNGSDWQYNGIYADPVAWLVEGSIDYISPQIYWSHASSTNPYGTLSKWWSETAKKFGKHFYSSQSFASGDQVEMGKQIDSNRSYDKNGAPGTVFFSTVDFLPQIVGDYLRANQFKLKALPPAIDWKEHPEYDEIGEVILSENTLTWTPVAGASRYSIYAVPCSLTNPPSHCSTSQYLLGMSYTNSYAVPLRHIYGYNFVVGLLDRYGNESLTGQTEPLDPAELSVPKIFAPENLSTVGSPVLVEWYPVPAASGFTVERSTLPDFSDATPITVGVGVYQASISELMNNTTYYVRVRAENGDHAPTDWSEPVQFMAMTVPDIPVITAPVNMALVPCFVTVSWKADARATQGFTIVWSTNADFSGVVYGSDVPAGTYRVTFPNPGNPWALTAGATYYLMIRANYDESSSTDWSDPVQFKIYDPTKERLLILGEVQGAPYGNHLQMPYTIDVGKKVYLGIRTGSNNGASIDWDSRLSYDLTSSNPNVATIDEFGEVIGIAPGTTVIKAVRRTVINKLEGTLTLTVRGIPLTLELDKTSIEVEETAELTITDKEGNTLNNQDCILESSNEAIVTVSPTGKITGISPGTARITAVRNSDDARGAVNITVKGDNSVITPKANAVIVYRNAEKGVVVLFNGRAVVELYTVTGILIEKTQAYQSYSRELDKGVYILRVNGRTVKFVR